MFTTETGTPGTTGKKLSTFFADLCGDLYAARGVHNAEIHESWRRGALEEVDDFTLEEVAAQLKQMAVFVLLYI